MAMVVITTLLVLFLSLFVKIAYDTIVCYFLNPRRIKKIMERQGVRGPKPRLLIGNILDMASFVAKTTSQDMNSINHDIVGRLLPHYVAWSKQYGIANNFSFLPLIKNNLHVLFFLYLLFAIAIYRKKIYILEWGGAQDVLDGD
jgi:hypothetical protein